MAQAAEADDRAQYLSFSLAGGEYGVGILKVREILQYEPVTRVPSVPRSVRGVINLRGAVVPVVDLSLKFGLPETPVSGRTCILIVEARLDGEPTVLGVLADSVSEVLELGPRDVEPAPAFGTRVKVDYLAGMGKVEGRFVLLLDRLSVRDIAAVHLEAADHSFVRRAPFLADRGRRIARRAASHAGVE